MNSKRRVNGKLVHVVQICVCRFCLTSLIRSQMQVVFSNLVESLSSWHLKVTDRWKKTKSRGLSTKKNSGKGKLPEQMRAQQTAHEFLSQGFVALPRYFLHAGGSENFHSFNESSTPTSVQSGCPRHERHFVSDISWRSWCGRVLFNVKLREVSTYDKFFSTIYSRH